MTGGEGLGFCEWGVKDLSDGEKVEWKQMEGEGRGIIFLEMVKRAEGVKEVSI